VHLRLNQIGIVFGGFSIDNIFPIAPPLSGSEPSSRVIDGMPDFVIVDLIENC
jgi:hypothetical protein